MWNAAFDLDVTNNLKNAYRIIVIPTIIRNVGLNTRLSLRRVPDQKEDIFWFNYFKKNFNKRKRADEKEMEDKFPVPPDLKQVK